VTEVELTPLGLVLKAFVPTASATCPHCGTPSSRIHSYYTRHPHDLPISGETVRLLLHLRRFRCLAAACSAVTFSERIPALIAPAAQRTTRLNNALRDLALAFGGEAGARQSARSAMAASGDTLLRRAHTATAPRHPTPRILGIDDFAFHKGQLYGTILTDGETHAVVDLLPDRSAQTATSWLREHPGIEIITRDRASDYTRAGREGAPHAVQVADRFHLSKNAGDVLERIVGRHHHGLRTAAKAVDQQHIAGLPPLRDAGRAVPKQEKQLPVVATSRQDPHVRERRLARYQEVMARAKQGLGPKAIGRQVGLTRQTVTRWLKTGTFPERPPSAPRRMSITPYEPYLRERWEAGCRNGRELWREIQAKGFRGGHETVRRLLVTWRTERGRGGPPRKHPSATPSVRRPPPQRATRPWSPRQARWLLLKAEDELKPEQQAYIQQLGQLCPDVVIAQRLIVEFIQLVRKRDDTALACWLAAAEASGLPELREFAKGIVRDRAAVEAALQYKWSNGITEGHVNRLKMIKRTAYGRASFSLLRQRVLAQV
jgi:transposase